MQWCKVKCNETAIRLDSINNELTNSLFTLYLTLTSLLLTKNLALGKGKTAQRALRTAFILLQSNTQFSLKIINTTRQQQQQHKDS